MPKLNYSIIAIILFALTPFWSSAQNPQVKCGNVDVVKNYEKLHPEAFKKEKSKNKNQRAKEASDETCFVIPVVFHVFHDGGAASVTPEQVQSALDRANLDFNLQNDDANTIDPAFDPIKQSLPITFVLAKLDPQGNPTTGIKYYPEEEGFGDIYKDATIASYAWDNFKYMNVYVMEDLYADNDIYNSGVAWYPSQSMSNQGTARIVYNHRYLGNTGTSLADKEFQSVFTHECGHYLNLAHVFDDYDCNGPGDYVDDTPATDESGAGCNATVCGHKINGENYMDYNVDCQKMFTQGQVDRMMDALDHSARSPLWQVDNLIATGVANYYCGDIPDLITYSGSTFSEVTTNNGTSNTQITIQTTGSDFATGINTFTEGTHFNIYNVPNGFTAKLSYVTAKSVTLTLEGTANNHLSSNSISNMQFEFLAAGFSDNTLGTLQNTSATFSVSFIDPYEVICDDITDELVNANSTWEFIDLGVLDLGLWIFENDKFKIEFYGNEMAVTSGNNIQLLTQGTQIDGNLNWHKYDAYPDQHDLYNANEHTDWLGQEGYAAIRFKKGTFTHYGWIKFDMSANGSELTIKEWGYNSQPGGAIKAGSCTADALDCANVPGGTAIIDNCNECVEGNTGKTACTQDCYGDWGGDAYFDVCKTCAGGNTGKIGETNPANCIITNTTDLSLSELNVFPNPFKNTFNIEMGKINDWNISLISFEGQIVYQRSIVGDKLTIDTKNLTSGIYFLKISSNLETRSVKVIKF